MFQQPIGGAFNKGRLVLTANLHGKHTRGSGGVSGPSSRLVGETGLLVYGIPFGIQGRVVGSTQVSHGIFDGGRGYV